MNGERTSRRQVAGGVVLGILLQPVSLLLLLAINSVTSRDVGWATLNAILLYVTCFGMAQVLTILPAALLMLFIGRLGIVRGLLYVGTILALANVAFLIAAYQGHWGPLFRSI